MRSNIMVIDFSLRNRKQDATTEKKDWCFFHNVIVYTFDRLQK